MLITDQKLREREDDCIYLLLKLKSTGLKRANLLSILVGSIKY